MTSVRQIVVPLLAVASVAAAAGLAALATADRYAVYQTGSSKACVANPCPPHAGTIDVFAPNWGHGLSLAVAIGLLAFAIYAWRTSHSQPA